MINIYIKYNNKNKIFYGILNKKLFFSAYLKNLQNIYLIKNKLNCSFSLLKFYFIKKNLRRFGLTRNFKSLNDYY